MEQPTLQDLAMSICKKEKCKWNPKKKPTMGDHIRVGKSFCGITLYEHHGIYISDDEVIHFSGEPGRAKLTAKVVKTDLKTFLRNNFFRAGALEVRDFDNVENKYRLSPEEIVANARRIYEEGIGAYNLITNNCEHLANLCIFGKKISEQVLGIEPIRRTK